MVLRIRHRLTPEGAPPPALEPSAATWRTCLREITFLDGGASKGDPSELSGPDAYALLLEILCGLHSPIVGETQVLGQFRTYLRSLSGPEAARLSSIGDRLITDAREVRERHLRGVSSGSYGGEVRRRLRGCSVVAIIGRGALAAELHPYLEDCGRLDEWTRDGIEAAGTRPVTREPAGLVIAAPVGNAAIHAVADRYANLRSVVDLRAPDHRAPLALPDVSTLEDLFAAVQASAIVSEDRVAGARMLIRDLADAFGSRQYVRPFGWDDLCA